MRPTELWAHRSTKSGMQLSSYPIRTANCTVPQRNSTGPLYGTRMWNAMNSTKAPIRIHSWSLSQKMAKKSYLVGGWALPLWKIWLRQLGWLWLIIPNIWKVIKFHGSKPPTRYTNDVLEAGPFAPKPVRPTGVLEEQETVDFNACFTIALNRELVLGTNRKQLCAWRQAKGWPFSLSTSFNRVLVCFDYCLRHETVDCVADRTGE